MGFLAPWFLAATAGIALPLYLHLLKRQTTAPKEVSSLMLYESRTQSSTRHRRLRYFLLLSLRLLWLVLLILAFANPAPTACYEIYAAWKEGDAELARVKQERIAKAAERLVGGLSIPGVKYAMDFNGYFGGPVRLPLLPLTSDGKAEIEKLMESIRN